MTQYSEEERAHLRAVAGAWDERKRLEETSESLRQASVATKREIKRRLSRLLGSLQSTRNSGNAKRQFKRKKRACAREMQRRKQSRWRWLVHSKRRKKRRLFRSLLFRLTSLHQLEEQQDTLKTLLASSSQKPLSSLSSFLERTTLRGVIGTLFDIGLVLRSAESSRAIHAVLGKALEDTAVVEDREVSASSSSHFRQLQRLSKRSDTTTAVASAVSFSQNCLRSLLSFPEDGDVSPTV